MSNYVDKSCVILSSIYNSTSFSINSTSEPLDIYPIIYPPFITYDGWQTNIDNEQVNFYRFCGPLVVLMTTFSKRIKTELLFHPVLKDVLTAGWKLAEEAYYEGKLPTFYMMPMSPMKSWTGILGDDFGITRYIGGMDGDVVLSRTQIMDRPVFAFLDCWDLSIYLGLLISILTISLVYGLMKGSLWAIPETIWDYLSVFLSDSFANRPKHSKERILAIIWLLVNTLLLSIFSGQLYEFIIRGKIVNKIENREQLTTKDNWKHSKVFGFDFGFIDYIVNEGISEKEHVASELLKRLEMVDPIELVLNKTLQKYVFDTVFKENAVITTNKLLTYWLLRYVQNQWPQFANGLIEGYDYYISQPVKQSMCYFLGINEERINQTILVELNNTISRLQENGIYEYEVQKSVTPKGFGQEIYQEPPIPIELIIKPIKISEIKGVSILLLTGLAMASIALIIEILFSVLYF